MQSSSGFHKLPAETIENILRLCAVGGHPFTIAAVAQTCRLLRVLVYDAGDRHLWHTLFLVLFDNPKSATSYTEDYDWRNECTERLWAQAYIHRHARPLQVKKKPNLRSNGGTLVHVDELHDDGQEHSEAHIRVLRALLSVITTAAPLVPQRNAVSVQEGARSEHTALTQLHVETPLSPPSLVESEDHLSLNMTWLKETLSHGLPFSLTKLLSEYHGRDWRVLPEGQDLCHLTGYLGFIPIPMVGTDETPAHIARAGGNNEWSSGLRFRARRTTATGFLDMRETLQRQRAKLSARHLAFYITYLSRRRNWGPYLPSPPIIIKFQNVRLVEEDDDDEDMDSDSESDGDYHPPDDSNHTSSSATPEPHGEDPQRRDAAPLPDHLYPDWTWLAAARIIAECKLRAHVDPADIARLEDWDNLRSGAWVPSLSSEPMDDDTDARRSSERKSQTQGGNAESEEWRKYERDWAGVEGTWRRLVCWLDYDDLIYHSAHGRYDDPDLDEAWIIVPMSLRIAGYSAPSLPGFSDRPTIHVEGEMGGAGWVGSVDANDDDVRHVHGFVSMLPDDNVRWSITSTAPNSMEDEWSSEAVQLGGVGSAMGSLGMWTGALHEEDDPLGIFWQWRVR